MLCEAIKLAVKAHAGQMDKCGQPYILHPLRVMFNVPDYLRVPAVLHDVVEDTKITLDMLRQKGFSDEDVSVVDALTKRQDEKYADYIKRVSLNTSASIIKIQDLYDNMLPERNQFKGAGSLMKRYKKALWELKGVKVV